MAFASPAVPLKDLTFLSTAMTQAVPSISSIVVLVVSFALRLIPVGGTQLQFYSKLLLAKRGLTMRLPRLPIHHGNLNDKRPISWD
jgi:hypothetical protein